MRVGALDVSILVDAEGSFATIAEAFPALSSNDEWRLPVNAVLIRGAGTTLLVDTGLGPEPRAFMPDGGARLLEELASAGTGPDEVDLVVHTHLHVDHVGWDGFFPNARYAVPADEWSYFMSEESVYVSDHDSELSAVTRKQVLGRLADRGTDVIVGNFHGPGRFTRSGDGFAWSSLAEEREAAVE